MQPNCEGMTDLFFPLGATDEETDELEAQAVTTLSIMFCEDCVFLHPCRKIGENEDYGIFAGTTGKQRREARRISLAASVPDCS